MLTHTPPETLSRILKYVVTEDLLLASKPAKKISPKTIIHRPSLPRLQTSSSKRIPLISQPITHYTLFPKNHHPNSLTPRLLTLIPYLTTHKVQARYFTTSPNPSIQLNASHPYPRSLPQQQHILRLPLLLG